MEKVKKILNELTDFASEVLLDLSQLMAGALWPHPLQAGWSHGLVVNGLGYVPGAAFVSSAVGLSCSGQKCWSPDPPAQIQALFLWQQKGWCLSQRSKVTSHTLTLTQSCLFAG